MQTVHTVIESMQLVCNNCGYSWEYKGDKQRTSCSRCKTSITIQQHQRPDLHTMHTIISAKPRHDEAFMPLPLAKHLMGMAGLSRLIGLAHANDDKSIRFKINEQGELYLP